MDENVLTLEKLNADRITRLEAKVDRILEFVSNKKNGGDWRMITVIVAVVIAASGLLGQNIVFLAEQMSAEKVVSADHRNSHGHTGLLVVKKQVESLEDTRKLSDAKLMTEIKLVKSIGDQRNEMLGEKMALSLAAIDRLLNQRMDSIDKDIRQVDTKIQLEVRAAENHAKEMIKGLDEKLQIEFGNDGKTQLPRA